MKVLLAIGEKNLSQILKGNLEDAGFEIAKEEVLHRDYLNEKIDFERPNLLIIHDRQLPSQFSDKEQNEEELLQLIESWRRVYDAQMRVVIMCERERKDPFLSQLVARNVLDIFNERQIPTASLIRQLKEPARYMNVSRYGLEDAAIDSLMESAETKGNGAADSKKAEIKTSFLSKKKLPKLPKVPKPQRPNISINFPKASEIQEEIALQERKIILVVSPFERSGSTFIAHQLAYAIAKNGIGVKYFENPFKNPYTYDRLAGGNEIPNYYSPYSEIPEDDHNAYIREWKKDGIELQVLNPKYEQRLEEDQFPITRFLRQLLSVHNAPYLIVDIGADENKQTYDELVEVASHVLVVVDNDLPNLELFEQYQMAEKFGWIHNLLLKKKTHLIANRYVKGLETALPLDHYTPVPPFQDESTYKAQFDGVFAFKDAADEQQKGFQKLMKLIVDSQDLKRKKNGVKKVKNWMPSFEFLKDKEKMEEST